MEQVPFLPRSTRPHLSGEVRGTGYFCFICPETVTIIHLCSSLGIPGGFGLNLGGWAKQELILRKV